MIRVVGIPFVLLFAAGGLVLGGAILWYLLGGNDDRVARHGMRMIAAIALLVPVGFLAARVGSRAFAVSWVGTGAWVVLALAVVWLAARSGNRSSTPREVRAILIRRGIMVAGAGFALGLGAHILVRNPLPIVDYAVLAMIGLGAVAALRASLKIPDDDPSSDETGGGNPTDGTSDP